MSEAPLFEVSIRKKINHSLRTMSKSNSNNNASRESEFSIASAASGVSRMASDSSMPDSRDLHSNNDAIRTDSSKPMYDTVAATINRRNFYQTCNMKDGSEFKSNSDEASLGTKGTFRAKAIARRWANNSRRNLLKQSQGISVQSLLSNMTADNSERAHLIPEDEGGVSSTSSRLKSDDSSDMMYGSINESAAFNGSIKEKKEENIWINFLLIWIGKPISFLLLFFPFALAAYYLSWGPQWVFWLNFLVMIPLASILGDFTEEAALHTNDVVGGLLNASFGNAVEVVVGFNALMKDEIRVVQASMIGSIFSNLLLVLGCCFFFGGLYYKEQKFSSLNATTSMGLLALSSIALILPTPFAEYYEIEDKDVLIISRASACFLIFTYVQLLYFQLFTHREIFEGNADDDDEENGEDDIEEEEASIPMWMALTGLCLTTGLVTIFSNFLVDSINGFCTESGVSRTFVGLIILPIVGNAVEHVRFIYKNLSIFFLPVRFAFDIIIRDTLFLLETHIIC